MEKEEFIKSKNIIISSIDKLNKELMDLKSKYIEANAKFKNGEKVLATHKNGVEKFLFVSSLSINYSNDISYRYNKCKKDGTVSMHEDWCLRNWEISKIKEL